MIRKMLIIALSLTGLTAFAAQCAGPGSTMPVLKIGLIAPFEGAQRANGYQRLYGVKLALQAVNLNGGVAGYKIELVALNDNAEAIESVLQARELVLDPDVVAVVGNWQADLFQANETVFQGAGLAVVNPAGIDDFSGLPASFAADYQAFGGALPDEQAMQAYAATQKLLRAIKAAARENARLHRSDIFDALPTIP